MLTIRKTSSILRVSKHSGDPSRIVPHLHGEHVMSAERQSTYLDRTVGDLVAEDYGRAAVFAGLGIDFCCGGRRPAADACAAAGVAPERLEAALGALDAREGAPRAPEHGTWPIRRLVDHIEEEHHAYVRKTLPVLDAWTEKVAGVHGSRHPELLEVRSLFRELAEEMSRHLDDEESVLFPRLVASEGNDTVAGTVPDAVLEALEDDHDHAGAIVRRIREITDGFTPPRGACATYRATYHLLSEFEDDLHRHVHLENNVLFPRVRTTFAHGETKPEQ